MIAGLEGCARSSDSSARPSEANTNLSALAGKIGNQSWQMLSGGYWVNQDKSKYTIYLVGKSIDVCTQTMDPTQQGAIVSILVPHAVGTYHSGPAFLYQGANGQSQADIPVLNENIVITAEDQNGLVGNMNAQFAGADQVVTSDVSGTFHVVYCGVR